MSVTCDLQERPMFRGLLKFLTYVVSMHIKFSENMEQCSANLNHDSLDILVKWKSCSTSAWTNLVMLLSGKIRKAFTCCKRLTLFTWWEKTEKTQSTVWWLPDVLKTELKKLFQMELWTGTRWNVTNTECILNFDVVNLLYTCISLHLSIHSSPGDNPVLLLHIALLSAVPCVNVGC